MKKRIITNHTNITIGEEYGLAIIYQPGFSVYILLGFISVNIRI